MRKIYMVGNTHFDPVWLWRWDEAMASIRATFRSALDRMDETPDFFYSFATPPVFEWIKKTDPQLFSDIKKAVDSGRWELPEAWWVQPDCYSASGESYVRQGLYGQKYLFDNFGKMSNGVFNVDSFGHSPNMPQILKKSHVDYYCFVRPEKRHIPLESQFFNWKGIDGSRLSTFRADMPYEKDLKKTLANQEDTENDIIFIFGVTDHGGAPTKKMLKEIAEMPDAEFSTVDRFFKEHKTDYTVSNELYTGDFGVYANYPKIKRLNRIAEYAAMNAERASLIAGNYDKEKISDCWKDILFNQFHDIIGGASIKDAYFDAENSLGRAIQTSNELMHFAIQSVTAKMKTVGSNPDTIWNVVVWNLNGSDYDGYVEAEVQWAHEFDWYDGEIDLADGEGNIYHTQIIREKSVIPRFRSRFVFKAKIPAMGYKMFRLILTGNEVEKPEIDPFCFNTERCRIEFDSASGILKSVTDKKTGKKLCENAFAPRCYFDDGDTWSFNVKSYDNKVEIPEFKSINVLESGAVETLIEVTYKFKNSLIYMYYKFFNNETDFEISYKAIWNEQHYVMKLEVPTDCDGVTAAVPYGSVERRANSADMPLGAWVKAGDMIVAPDGMFAYNMIGSKLGFTVLRSAIHGDFRLGDLDYNDHYDIISEGVNEGRLHIAFSGDGWRIADSFCNPPVVVDESCHDGTLPDCDSFVNICSGSTAVTTVKKCEWNDGTVIRLVEQKGKPDTAKVNAFGTEFETKLSPFEIKTVLIKDGKITEVYMTEEEEICF